MVMLSLTPKTAYWLSFPAARDLTQIADLYSLPMIVHRQFGHPLPVVGDVSLPTV